MDMHINEEEQSLHTEVYPSHYHGDMVRRLFFSGGIIMILALPFFKDLIPVPEFISILAMLIIGFMAGLTNPRLKWTAFLDCIISLVAFATFEFSAIKNYSSPEAMLFWLDQALAIIFFLALYYSTKTLRGFILRKFK